MFSKEDSSGDEIYIYVKLFLYACNAFSKGVKNRKKREGLPQKNEETTFFSSKTSIYSLLDMPEMMRLHGNVKEISEGVTESYAHLVNEKMLLFNECGFQYY